MGPAVVLVSPAALCSWRGWRAALAPFVVVVVAAVFLVGTRIVVVVAVVAV